MSETRVAAVDVGSNTVHMLVGHVHRGSVREVHREVLMPRIGAAVQATGRIGPEKMQEVATELSRLREVALAHGAAVQLLCATEAVRRASDRELAVEVFGDAFGVPCVVVPGEVEARLSFRGASSVVSDGGSVLVCDIGGGSTELLVGLRGEVQAARSLKLGALRLTRRFFDGNLIHPGAVDACRRHVRSTLAPFVHEVRGTEIEVAVGSSGTIVALAEMAAVRATGTRPRSVSNLRLTRADLDGLVKELLAAKTTADRADLPGLDPARADIILAGAVILEQVLHVMDVEELLVSDYALREGVLLDAWHRRHGGSLHHLSDLRRRSVLDLANLMDDDPAHSAQVTRLALDLFDGTAGRHGLGDDARETLEAAALLCNVGLFLSHAQHHKHSYYVIRGTDRLAGFTDHEVERIALVARYHRKSEPRPKHPEFARLDEADQHLVRCLAGILRVAIGLDRNHAARVADIVVDDRKKRVTLTVVAEPGEDIGLELYEAEARKDLLESVLGVPIEVVEAA